MGFPVRFLVAALALCLMPDLAGAVRVALTDEDWFFATRVALSGTSDESDPQGITIYSGVALEAALRRDLGRRFAAELSARTESREVDRDTGAEEVERLGSLEFLPLTLTLQYHPKVRGRFHPYVGAGANLTVAWEKSGFLDTYDVEPHVGPALQLGADIVLRGPKGARVPGLNVTLGPSAVLNLDLRWNTLTTAIARNGEDFASVTIDPLTLAAGIGLSF